MAMTMTQKIPLPCGLDAVVPGQLIEAKLTSFSVTT